MVLPFLNQDETCLITLKTSFLKPRESPHTYIYGLSTVLSFPVVVSSSVVIYRDNFTSLIRFSYIPNLKSKYISYFNKNF